MEWILTPDQFPLRILGVCSFLGAYKHFGYMNDRSIISTQSSNSFRGVENKQKYSSSRILTNSNNLIINTDESE